MVYKAVKLKDHSKHLIHFTYLRAHGGICGPGNVLKRAMELQKPEKEGQRFPNTETKTPEKPKLVKELRKSRKKE